MQYSPSRLASDMACTSSARRAVPVLAPEGETAVGHHPGLKTQVAGHAHRGLDGVVGDDADDDQGVVARVAQPLFQAGADEGVVGLLADDRLAGRRQGFRLEGMPGWPGR